MCIENLTLEDRICPCGCGQSVPVYLGQLRYGPDNHAGFAVTHMEHCESGPHVWFMLRSGPWVAGDDRDCWVTMHLYTDNDNVVTRIEDPDKSPFWRWEKRTDRYLTREEVLSQEGGKDWAIDRRLDFEAHHQPTVHFLLRPSGAQHAGRRGIADDDFTSN